MEIETLVIEILQIHCKHHNIISRVPRTPLPPAAKKRVRIKMAADFSIGILDTRKQ